MKKIARRNFLKLVGVSASIPILQSLPIASASATDLSDYPLLKDGIFDFENTDITQYVDINKVIVKSSSLQAYNLTKATWQSSIEFSGMVWVK